VNYLSVATGISAETLAWRPLGMKPVAFAQFDPEHKYKSDPDFASAVLAHHYPDVRNLGDMTKFEEWPDYADVNVLTGGTPCQSYSVAGLGAGLDDPRGDLALTYAAIARRYRPAWLVWENVGGVLSNDKGSAFGAILGLLSGQRIETPSGGWRTAGVVPGIARAYGLAWRVFDTQYVRVDGFGRAIPQRRRRVFVVGYLGDWRRAAAVLFEREGLSGNPPPRRRPGEGVAPTISARTKGGGGLGIDFDCDGGLIPEVSPPLMAGDNKTGGDRSPGMDIDTVHSLIPHVANPLTARMHKGVNTTMDEGQRQTMVPTFAIQERAVCENPNAGPDGVGIRNDGAAYTMEARSVPQDVAFKASHFTRGKDGAPVDVALGYAGRRQEDEVNLVAFNARQDPVTSQYTTGALDSDGTSQAVAFQDRFRGDDGRGYDRPPAASPDVCGTLETVKPWNVTTGWSVRRLMPVECERLQGVPDGFTAIPFRGKPAADGPRYKVLGNMQSVNVVRWIGTRIKMVETIR
jgi:DNA (cytosine-5)-methyltransferase 1